MKKIKVQTIRLTPEADAVLETRKAQTGVSKQIILNRIVLAAGRRWYPEKGADDKATS